MVWFTVENVVEKTFGFHQAGLSALPYERQQQNHTWCTKYLKIPASSILLNHEVHIILLPRIPQEIS